MSHTIGFAKLKDRYNNRLFVIAAILFIIGWIMPLVNIIIQTTIIPLGLLLILHTMAYVILYRVLKDILYAQ